MNLSELIDASATRFPDKPAIINTDAVVSYSELMIWTRELAGALRAAGVQAGQRIGVSFPNSAAYVAAIFAVWRAHATAVPVPVESSAEERARILHSLGLAG